MLLVLVLPAAQGAGRVQLGVVFVPEPPGEFNRGGQASNPLVENVSL